MNNSRHLGIFSPQDHKDKRIHIIGCGNIGSHTAVAIARMGFENIVLYDYDRVEDVNIATQNFTQKDKDRLKVNAVKSKIREINKDASVIAKNVKLNLSSDALNNAEDIPVEHLCIVCGVDSIKIRRMLKKLISSDDELKDTPIIDGRLGKEQVEVLYSNNSKSWDTSMDDDTTDIPCTEKYISYTPIMCASLISNTIKKLCKKEHIEKEAVFEFASNFYLVKK